MSELQRLAQLLVGITAELGAPGDTLFDDLPRLVRELRQRVAGGIGSAYPDRFVPGIPPGEDGEYPAHTPWLKFGPASWASVAIRCGGPSLPTSHQSFDDLLAWAEHVAAERDNARLDRYREALESVAATYLTGVDSGRCWESWPDLQDNWCPACVAQYALDPWTGREQS